MTPSPLTAQGWKESAAPVSTTDLAPVFKTRTEKAFRETFGDRFLVLHFDPRTSKGQSFAPTMATITVPAAPERAVPSWVYLVEHSKRSAFASFITVGRAKNNDIALEHPSISRFHAMIIETAGGIALYDGGSKHGSFVDGLKAPKQGTGSPLVLRSRMKVRFGALEMTFMDASSLIATFT